MGWSKSKEAGREQPISKLTTNQRKLNKPAMMRDGSFNARREGKPRSNSNALLEDVVNGIRPKFEVNEETKTKEVKNKKIKEQGKRYRRILLRVEHHRDGDESSYSSLWSEWQTIKSEDERLRSNSNLNDISYSESKKVNPPIENIPFEFKNKSKDEKEQSINDKINKRSDIQNGINDQSDDS